MAFIIADRVRETSTTTGTGNFTLAGAVIGYQTFDAVLNTSDTTFYVIALQGGSEWEVGVGTFTSPATLARTSVLASSNSGSAVNFSAGTKDVFISLPAGRALTGFSAGTTGLTPSTPSYGDISLAGTLVAANGGTGQNSYTIGDLLYASGSTALSKLAGVATGNALISGGVGTAPSWGKIGLTTHVTGTLGVSNGGTGTATAFTTGSVLFAGASGVYSQDNGNFFWDDTNNRLGIGTATPATPLHVVGDVRLSSINAGQLAGLRNAIINGGFDIWQRGTSFSNPGSGNFTADMWSIGYDGSGATRTISRQTFAMGQTDVPGSPEYFYRYDQSVAGSGATKSTATVKIEDVTTFSGQSVTVSFYAKAGSSITLPNIILGQFFGTGGSPSANVDTTVASSVSITTSWTRYSYTVSVPSVSGKTKGSDGNDCLILDIQVPINTTFTLDLSNVQVELGSVATPFERRTIALEQSLCDRYFQLVSFRIRFEASVSSEALGFTFPIRQVMRVDPSFTVASTGENVNVLATTPSARTTDYSLEVQANNTGGTAYSGTAWLSADL